MNRRNFIRSLALLGGSLSLPGLLQACGLLPAVPANTPVPAQPSSAASPTETPSPQPQTEESSPEPGTAQVGLVKTSDRVQGIRMAVELLGINPAAAQHVLLKPNFNSADRSPGSTHNDTLHTLLALLSEMGAASITITDRSGMGDTHQVMQQKGIFDLAGEFNASVQVLDELSDEEITLISPPDSHWQNGFPVPNMLLDSSCVIQTCNLKTHGYGGFFTMSLKNSVGFVAKYYQGHNYMTDLHSSPDQRKMIAEINTAYHPALIVLDGVQAFVSGGPHAGTLADTELILAGTDPVAIDAIGVAVLRIFGTTPEVSRGRVFEQEQIARAVELGLGVDSPEKIQILTEDEASAAYAAEIIEVLNA
ncbi:MAG: DUF362 domain-containing protein [Anaerolineales bacterium]|nr:DUF362 domain-containing protein [Anaerolineales bacterium]